MKLNTQPTSDVVISVTRTGSSDVTVSPATLTFTTSNWSTAKTVTVRAAQDADTVNDAASIAHAVDASRSANEYDAVSIAGVAVTVTDDETAGVTVSETTLTVAEGANATYTVKLNTQPASNVVIGVTKTGSSDVTASPATLTFTTSNWSTAQTVTVRAAQDADTVNDAASIAHAVVAASSADEFDAVTIAGVAVTVTDDDTAGVTVSASTLTVNEGAAATYTVRPEHAARLRRGDQRHQDRQYRRDGVSSHPDLHHEQLEHGADGDGAGRPGRRHGERRSLHRPRGGGRQQRRRVRRRDHRRGGRDRHRRRYRRGDGIRVDAVGDRGRQRNLHGGPEHAARLRRGDQRHQDRQYRRDGVAGHPDLLLVQLEHGEDGDGAGRPGRRRSERHGRHRPRVDAAQSANEYDAVTIAGVTVSVTDDDTAGVTVSASTLSVTEGGSATYTVRLNTQPTSNVVISVTKTGSTDVTASPATLTFTTSNWSTAQTVTVRAAQDADAVNDAASITHAVDASRSANEFDAVNIAGVTVSVTDDDTVTIGSVAVSETTLTVAEGSSATYTVRLNTQPASNVVISVTRTGSSDVTASPATLTFTTSNWSTAQTVTVRAAQDADAANDTAAIAHAVVTPPRAPTSTTP